jgi:hypothetical protein
MIVIVRGRKGMGKDYAREAKNKENERGFQQGWQMV